MTARRVAVFMAVLLLVCSPGEAGLADQVGATFGLLVQEVMTAFPAVEGLVVSVDGDRVYLDLTEKDGVQRGQEFTVFRKGEEFRHPFTQKPLGRFEDVLGYAQITRVEPRFSEALFIPVPDRAKVAAEDGVRITRGRIKVAVAPTLDLTKAQADLRRVPFMIALGLDQTKRFQAVDPGVVQELFLNQRARIEELLVRPERAVSLGRTLDVSGWLVPVLIDRRGITYLDVTWISAVTGHPALLPPPGPDPGAGGQRAALPLGAPPGGLICYALPDMRTPRTASSDRRNLRRRYPRDGLSDRPRACRVPRRGRSQRHDQERGAQVGADQEPALRRRGQRARVHLGGRGQDAHHREVVHVRQVHPHRAARGGAEVRAPARRRPHQPASQAAL